MLIMYDALTQDYIVNPNMVSHAQQSHSCPHSYLCVLVYEHEGIGNVVVPKMTDR